MEDVPVRRTGDIALLIVSVAAADLSLSPEEIERLDAVLPPEVVAGPRYNERMMSYIDR